MNKFEQLIEFVINDEEAKARELFHEIVVEKSRQIYEDMMNQDTKLGGDQAESLMSDIDADETGMVGEDEDEDEEMIDVEVDDTAMATDDDMGSDHHDDIGGNEELEDRVMDLEDQIDELMAEFESRLDRIEQGMDTDDQDMTADMDDMDGMDAEAVADDEMETEGMMRMPMGEAVSLKAAPRAVTSEEGSVNKKSTVAANSGSRGAVAQPVKMTGDTAEGRPAPQAKDMITDFQNRAGASMKDQKAAPKAQMKPANGDINNKTPFPKA